MLHALGVCAGHPARGAAIGGALYDSGKVRVRRCDGCVPGESLFFLLLRAQLTLALFRGQVETFLYKVHRHFFERHSEHFVHILRTYTFDGASHILLPGVKKADFECLLSVFYPAYASMLFTQLT